MHWLTDAVRIPKALGTGLPRGGLLPRRAWERRHRGVLALLWLHAVGFSVFVSIQPDGLSLHTVAEVGVIAGLAALASWSRPSREMRTAVASLGLISCSALLVHLSDGVIEMHFHFFVALAVIALYEEWLPFLLALGYVVLDHGLVGALAPTLVYNHPDAIEHPWKWAVIHAAFVLAASTASVVHWRLSEVERVRASNEQAKRVRAQAAREAAEIELGVRKEVEARLQEQAGMLAEQARLLDLTHDAILVWDLSSGAIQFWNRGAEELYGWARDEVLGQTPQAVLRTCFPRPLAQINQELLATGRWEGELEHTRRDGSTVVVASRWALQQGQLDRPHRVMAINSNVTEQKLAQAALERQARHDSLTGLPNRTFLGNHLQQALLASQQSGGSVALLMLDLDRFKEVNDTLGHERGDELLRAVGLRLMSELRDDDMLARLGGDEFAVVLPAAALNGAERVANKLLRSLEAPFDVGDANVSVGGSIGIALAPDHGTDAETLLRCADVAMYAAKRSACGQQVYVAAHDQHSRERLEIVGDLRSAVECDGLVLHFQPKLDCATREPVGLEALVRWQHPRRGLIPPDEFIPLAEQYGLINVLGRRVLDLALREVAGWSEMGLALPVAVNLSMREVLDPELPSQVSRLLEFWLVDPRLLRLEITESSLMVDPNRATATLQRLCDLGIQLSVDDFGTGYSSLRYLQQLPVDELKIDRSFVRHMVTRDSDLTIVRSTIDLAHGLGLKVVAEGVEDALTWQLLAESGCDQAQGYFISRPMPVTAATDWLRFPVHPIEQAAA